MTPRAGALRRCRLWWATALVLLAALGPAACGTGRRSAATADGTTIPVVSAPTGVEAVTVTATTNILADVVRSIGGADIDVVDVMARGADPHSFGLSAADLQRVAESELIVTNGLGLEAGLVDALRAAADRGTTVLEVAPLLDPLPVAGEAGGALDPHVWTDPRRMATGAERIGAAIAAEARRSGDGQQATRIEQGAARYAAVLRALDAELAEKVAALAPAQRRLVTNHHALGYFAERYGFEVLGAVIPSASTLASPSAADLADILAVIRAAGVPAIFADSSHPTRLAEVLAAQAGTEVAVVSLHTESLGAQDGPAGTYVDAMRTNTEAIVAALGGRG